MHIFKVISKPTSYDLYEDADGVGTLVVVSATRGDGEYIDDGVDLSEEIYEWSLVEYPKEEIHSPYDCTGRVFELSRDVKIIDDLRQHYALIIKEGVDC